MEMNYCYSEQLRTISKTKIGLLRQGIIDSCPNCSTLNKVGCEKCDLKSKLFNRYIEANIPLDFIDKSMKDFYGDKKLVKLFEYITDDLLKSFSTGQSFILRGAHGTGKTMIASLVLKKAVEKGMSGLYTTLSDVVNVLVYAEKLAKFTASRELKLVDWLVIDEFDSRFMGSDVSAELFGRILEAIIRIRFQNTMPVILITNQPDPTKALGDQLGASISSLISGYCTDVPVIGKDFRKNRGV
jgi:DNA replication protein DnaC